MASRLIASSARSAVRPSARVVAPRAALAVRHASSSTDDKASALIDQIPSTSWATKTGSIVAGVGLSAAAISNNLLIVDAELVVAAANLALYIGIYRTLKEPFNNWADGVANKIRSTLEAARDRHSSVVQSRIDQVGQMKDSVDLTKAMFALSKETAQLEAENFVLSQENAIAAEAKTVLDSWVRHEQQVRESEQSELVKTIQANVLKQLAEPKFKKDLLSSAISEVEALVKNKAI